MAVTFRPGSVGDVIGSSDYPTLGCAGDVRLLAVSGDDLQLLESLTSNPGFACEDQVPLVVSRLGTSAIEVRYYAPGASPSGAAVAYAELHR
jgi:hypothetical protein